MCGRLITASRPHGRRATLVEAARGSCAPTAAIGRASCTCRSAGIIFCVAVPQLPPSGGQAVPAARRASFSVSALLRPRLRKPVGGALVACQAPRSQTVAEAGRRSPVQRVRYSAAFRPLTLSSGRDGPPARRARVDPEPSFGEWCLGRGAVSRWTLGAPQCYDATDPRSDGPPRWRVSTAVSSCHRPSPFARGAGAGNRWWRPCPGN
jgi:hypothetical protein